MSVGIKGGGSEAERARRVQQQQQQPTTDIRALANGRREEVGTVAQVEIQYSRVKGVA